MTIFLLCILTILTLVVIIYLFFKGNKTPLLYSFIGLQLMFFLLSACHLGTLLFPESPNLVALFEVIYEFPWCFGGTIWLLFCMLYTESNFINSKWMWKCFLFLMVIPLWCYLMVIADKSNSLLYPYIKGLTWGQAYVYAILGLITLARYIRKQSGTMKKLIVVLSGLIILVLVIDLIWTNSIYSQEFVTVLYNAVIAGLMFFFTIATFRYRFLNLVPIALRKIVDRMREAIVVVDGFNRIIDFNKRFVEFYGLNIGINEDFGSIFKLLKEKMEVSDTSQELLRAMKGEQYINAQGEICIRGLERKYFLVEIQLIPGRNHDNLGRIISFRDISEYKRLNQDLNRKNEELTAMNEELTAINDILLDANNKLQEHAATVEELAIARERNRIARDVHDTLGHTLSLLATILQVTSISCKKDPDQTQKKLQEGLILARKGLMEVRQSVSGMASQNMESKGFINNLEELMATFQCAGIKVDFAVDEVNRNLSPEVAGVIYRICQEALTNSLRHGKATEVNIIMKKDGRYLKLYIIDNGIGCLNFSHPKGFGLSGMRQRVENLGGALSIGSDGERGFNICAEIPLEG